MSDTPGGSAGTSAAGAAAQTGKIKIICGANSQELEHAVGQKLGDVLSRLREVLNIPETAQPIRNGQRVGLDHILQQGDVIDVLRPAGQKG